MSGRIEDEVPSVECPACKLAFSLRWEDYRSEGEGPITLSIVSCPSAGVYMVTLICPHCSNEVEL